MSQNDDQHKPMLVQAPVRALDPDGLAVVTAGTIAFAIGAAVCWWYADHLAQTGRLWYLGVAVTGVILGLIGLTVGLLRRGRRVDVPAAESQPAEPDPSRIDAE